jgi:hypothetical protein
MNQVFKDTTQTGFPKTKRPELFPVKEEHKNPCSYLHKNYTKLNQKAATMQYTKRDF